MIQLVSRNPRETAGKVPPNDLGAEGAVLSAVMGDETALPQISWLQPSEFYSEANRRIFEAARHLAEAGQTVNVVSVAGRLRDTNRLDQVGGSPYLAELVDKMPAVANLEEFGARIRDKAKLRSLISQCDHTRSVAYDYEGSSVELVVEHERKIFELAHDERSRHPERVGTVVYELFRELQEAAAAGKRITGIQSGFERLDKMTAGLHDDELTIIAARPGMGKTSLLLNIVRNIAVSIADDGSQPNGAIVFSLEMPKRQLAARWVCGEARVPAEMLRWPDSLRDDHWARLTMAAKDLYQLPIEIDDTPAIDMIDLTGKCQKFARALKASGQRLAVIAVDYLQLMSGSRRASSREQEISEISRGLKQLSKELHVPVIALSQLNRSVETRSAKDKRPQLSDLRESGAIEQDADNIIFIYRDDYYEQDSEQKGIAELIVAKQRNGPTGKVFVRFNAQYTRFDNLSPGEGPKEDEAA